MSYTEKRTLAQMTISILVFGAYYLTSFSRLSLEDSLRDWAMIMLIFIGVMVLASILLQILFHIFLSVGIAARETLQDHDVAEASIEEAIKGEFIEDEREKLISLKSRQAGCITSGIGLFAGLVSLVLNAPPALMLNIIFSAFFIGSAAEGITYLVLTKQEVSYA
jgi:hypothetical protein